MGLPGKDSRSKQDNQRYDHRSRNRELGSSSKFRNERNSRESRDDDRNLKARFGGYNFNVGTSELVAILRSMGDKYGTVPDDKQKAYALQRKVARITSTPYHPVGNGQAESTNKFIINNLKKRLEESKENWLEVLPGVLWAYRTTTKTSTGETPFSLVYGTEALIPVEIGEPSTRFIQATQESNDEEMRVNLDLLEARRETALIRMTAQKQVIE
ncbi:uncharacterized protein LOC142162012 [Nicotiana tabacum]|uniref:Uncharacterized protein LOC142162012 n=1 Tax=Nicotiana tabacum TaxID=4097 RepID=A0AC58RNX7_TOBAC